MDVSSELFVVFRLCYASFTEPCQRLGRREPPPFLGDSLESSLQSCFLLFPPRVDSSDVSLLTRHESRLERKREAVDLGPCRLLKRVEAAKSRGTKRHAPVVIGTSGSIGRRSGDRQTRADFRKRRVAVLHRRTGNVD